MLHRRVSQVAFGAIVATVTTCCLPAYADSFTEHVVATTSGSSSNVGLTASGTLVISETTMSGPEYVTFTPPSSYLTTPTAPTGLTFDNGASCTPTNTGAYSSVSNGLCNNGFEVFTASVGTSLGEGLYDGPDPTKNLVAVETLGGYDNLFLNSEGDIAAVAVTTPSGDENLLFVRGVTPEPSSFALLGTGLLTMAGAARRRFRGAI